MLPSLCALGWASFWSFPRPISNCLSTPTLSLAWPSLGESHLFSPQVMSPPTPAQLEPPLWRGGLRRSSGVRALSASVGPGRGVQGPEPPLTVPWGLGGWEVGGGRLAREGKS